MPQIGKFTHTAANRTNGHPVQGASVTIYREAAMVNGAQSGVSPLNVTVRHQGKLKAGDTVFQWTPGSSTNSTSTVYTVQSITSNTVVQLTGSVLSFADGDLLVPVGSKPTLYSDDQGSNSTANPLTTSADGLAECFIEFGAYSYIVSGGGLSAKLYHGIVAGSEAPGQVRFADNFAANSSTGGIQEAIDDLPSAGGEVRCSGKTYSLSTSLWLHSGVHLNGAGVGKTILQRTAGSITNGSAANSGGVVALGPKGSNGTLFTSGTSGSDIAISNLTMDGNQSTQPVTVTAPAPVGLRAVWVNGLYLNNVKVINTLQTGYYITNCADIHFSNFAADTVGQWSTPSDRNAISLHNGDNSTTNTNQGTLTNFYFKTVGDEAITMSGVQGLAVSNGVVDGCDFGIEFTAASSVAIKDCTFSNINFKNGIDFGITFNATVADASNINFNNLNYEFHSSNHDAGVIYLSSSLSSLSDITFSNITASNIHSNDSATARSWIDCQAGTGGKTRSRLFFNNLNFRSGAAASIKTGDNGIALRGPCTDMHFNQCRFKDVQGTGVFIDDSAAETISDISFTDVFIDGANYSGFKLRADTGASVIKGITFNNCTTRNIAKQAVTTDAGGWVLVSSFASSSINNIYLRGCRSFKTTGATHLYGLTLTQSGTGAVSNIFVTDCDFSNTVTSEILKTGTITGFQCNGFRYATQNLANIADTIALPSQINHCRIDLTSTGSLGTLTANPLLPDGGFDGQRVTIMNVDTADTITLDEHNIQLRGGAWALTQNGDSLVLEWSSVVGDWIQVSGANDIT